MHLVRLFWNSQSLMLKRIYAVLGFVVVFLLIHGTWTLRTNHQRAFAQAVERKIAIETIHVKAFRGALILTGQASKEQKLYAEYIARWFLERYSSSSINPPTEIRSEILIHTSPTSITETARPSSKISRKVDRRTASVVQKPKHHRVIREKSKI